jgi:branched-chain amino acid aminotransferase
MPVDLFMETVETLVKQDSGWVPNKVGESLYIRPFMIATEVGLGVRPTNKATYLLIATPAVDWNLIAWNYPRFHTFSGC